MTMIFAVSPDGDFKFATDAFGDGFKSKITHLNFALKMAAAFSTSARYFALNPIRSVGDVSFGITRSMSGNLPSITSHRPTPTRTVASV